MNKVLALLCLIPFCSSSCELEQFSDTLRVSINSEKHFQTIDGFGASDAWRCQFVGKNYPIVKKEQLADWLFSQKFDQDGNPKGIGLSIWRTELGAGSTEQGDESGIANVWRRGESFLNEDGTYDWSRMEGQKWFLKAAQKRGVEQFLAFNNAPPVNYSMNGKAFATKGNLNYNLKSDQFDDFTTYLVKLIKHFEEDEGIRFDYISPINEPQWAWDKGNQEGSPATNEDIFKLTKGLSEKLIKNNLKTQLTVGEAGQINYLYKSVKPYSPDNQIEAFWSKNSPLYLGNFSNVKKVISGHSYFTTWPINKQVSTRKELRQQLDVVDPDLAYWMSEFCILEKNDEIGQGGGRDLGMNTALYYTRVIHNDLTIANASSWQYWTAVSNHDYKDGLVYVDKGNNGINGIKHPDAFALMQDGEIRDSKSLWAFGNYARFIRPGFKRIDVAGGNENLLISAFQNPVNGAITMVVVNLGTDNSKLNIDFAPKVLKAKYVTNDRSNLASSKGSELNLSCSARSVSTLVFE
ncbi:O-Glycosyl hydrolase [Spirosomataceae bacterium TFI 002]|nr:O-Glycosyl hydrolase [Spirosomataceae bacterium TFI 002]